jgi:hypothetical protein
LDNPTALAELQVEADIEITATRVETFDEVEIHAHLTQGGVPMRMRQVQLQIEHENGGPARVVDMEPEGEGFAAHVTFFEPGEHHVQVLGMPEQHRLMRRMGETEVDVHRQHRVIGPYWFELGVTPAPVMENVSAEIHLYAFELHDDGSLGEPVDGLELGFAVHLPDGSEQDLSVHEVTYGEYEAPFTFGAAGLYELHVALEASHEEAEDEHGDEAEDEHEDEHGDEAEGEFHIRVLGEEETDGEGSDSGGGNGHDH